MPEPIRLAKRVIELTSCSRREAEQFIEGGWVRVNGEVVDDPRQTVLDHIVEVDPSAKLVASEPCTLLLHKPAGIEAKSGPGMAGSLITPDSHSATDFTGIRVLRRTFARLAPIWPLDTDASGLQPFTQDERLLHRVKDEGHRIEQEFVVDVAGDIIAHGLQRLAHGLSFEGIFLSACKVSWQSEQRLRFALCGVRPGQLPAMCQAVGLQALAIKRLRIGRVALSKMPAGEWRYLSPRLRF